MMSVVPNTGLPLQFCPQRADFDLLTRRAPAVSLHQAEQDFTTPADPGLRAVSFLEQIFRVTAYRNGAICSNNRLNYR